MKSDCIPGGGLRSSPKRKQTFMECLPHARRLIYSFPRPLYNPVHSLETGAQRNELTHPHANTGPPHAEPHCFHHVTPPRMDGQMEALCPGKGGLRPLPFAKGNFTVTKDQEDANREPPMKVKNHSSSFTMPLVAMTVRTNTNEKFLLNSF